MPSVSHLAPAASCRGRTSPAIRARRATRRLPIDGKTGKPSVDFGTSGEVDLSVGARWESRFNKLHLSNQSPVAIYKNTVLVGFGLTDRVMHEFDPPGWVRAYNAQTGKEEWAWYSVPRAGDSDRRPGRTTPGR